jgi:2-amino-4-hydroxy-6-hydroxymethyldihydropteridine diphosphokinase
MFDCLVGLGSNQGDRQAILKAAVTRLAGHRQIAATVVSTWRETAAVGGPPGQPLFLNGALRLQTALGPQDLLTLLQQVESELGRQRRDRWGPRTIDLDLLLHGELVLDTPSLVIPHPRMAWRRFVLEPAAEVAGEMLHPTVRWSIARLLEHLNSARPYVAVTGPIAAGKTQLAQRLADAIGARPVMERPDWNALDAFYADPPSHALQMELKSLSERARLLAPAASVWSEARWVVSDFWFDQSAAFARAWLPAEQMAAFLDQYERLRTTVVQPKLIVTLDAPAERLLARVQRRGRTCEKHLTQEQLSRTGQAIREQAHQPELGPVMCLDSEDSEAVLSEVLAAVQAME